MYKPKGYKVVPRQLILIRRISSVATGAILAVAGAKDIKSIKYDKFLEHIGELGLELHVIEDNCQDIPMNAPAALVGKKLKLRDKCYSGMCEGNKRDIFTLYHELGHLFLRHARQYSRDELVKHSFCEDSEWQANQFAAETLMPVKIILEKHLSSPEEFQLEFNYVSKEACLWRYERLKKESLI